MSDLLTFENRYPDMKELGFTSGGIPGFEYAYAPTDKMGEMERAGYSTLHGSQVFVVRGKAGECECIPMGKGEPISGVSADQFEIELYVHPEVEKRTGIPIDEREARETRGGGKEGAQAQQSKQG